MPSVTCTVRDAVAQVVIDNLPRHNAMTLGMWRELAAILQDLATRADVRVVVLRGAGERAFVSGADISEFETQRSNPQGVAAYDEAVASAQSALADFPRPVIAAIDGICYGGGMGLALACDMRLASRTARFRLPAARLGLGYAYDGIKRMVDLLGPTRAGEVIYTARVYDADEALRMGLIGSLHDDVQAQALTVASEIAHNAPLTVLAAKRAIQAALSGDAAARPAVDEAVRACFVSQDYAEGRQAFAEKRAPRFRGA